MTSGDYEGDWLEILTGPGAGKAGYITDHAIVAAVAEVEAAAAIPDNANTPDVDETRAAVEAVVGVVAYGMVTFDGTPGLSLAMTDLPGGAVFPDRRE